MSFLSQFESLEQMHSLGYLLKSEVPEVCIKQLWIDEIERRDISIAQLSALSGVYRQSLYVAARGDNGLSLESAFRISAVLNMPLEKLFEVDKSSLYSPCFLHGGLFVVHRETLEVLPRRSKKFRMMSQEEKNKYELLYREVELEQKD